MTAVAVAEATTAPAATEAVAEPTAEPAATVATGPLAAASFQEAINATVQIVAEGSFMDPEFGMQYNSAGAGTGFIIDPSGIAVTNNHVVTGAAFLQVYVQGFDEPLNARVLGVTECSDLAVIDIEGEGYPFLDWNTSPVSLGTETPSPFGRGMGRGFCGAGKHTASSLGRRLCQTDKGGDELPIGRGKWRVDCQRQRRRGKRALRRGDLDRFQRHAIAEDKVICARCQGGGQL